MAAVSPGYVKVCNDIKRAKDVPRSTRRRTAGRWRKGHLQRSQAVRPDLPGGALAASGSSRAAEQLNGTEDRVIAFFLLLVIVAIVLGIVGVVAKGLLYLLIIGIVVFLGALTLAALRMRRRPGKDPAR